MWKLSTTILIGASLLHGLLFAKEKEEMLVNYLKSQIPKVITVEKLTHEGSETLESPKGWEAHFLSLKLKDKRNDKEVELQEILFTDGRFIARDLIDSRNGLTLKKYITPPLPDDIYNEDHLVLGSMKAKHKLIIFSDPVCPFCMDFVPEAYEFVKKHQDQVALFYYHLPLTSIHPSAPILSKLMIAAHDVEDVIPKVYQADFDYQETNVKILIDSFNKQIGTKLTKKDYESKSVAKHLEEDMKAAGALMITGTPTILVNGKKDPKREKFAELKKGF